MALEDDKIAERQELPRQQPPASMEALSAPGELSDFNAPWLLMQPELVWSDEFLSTESQGKDPLEIDVKGYVGGRPTALETEGQRDLAVLPLRAEEFGGGVGNDEEFLPAEGIEPRIAAHSGYAEESDSRQSFGLEKADESGGSGGLSSQTALDDQISAIAIDSFALVEDELGDASASDTSTADDGIWIDGYTSGEDAIDDSLEYNVEIDFVGEGWTAPLAEDFIVAADYLSTVITGDVYDIELFGEIVDDIVITAALVDIDGPGGVLGMAGPEYIRAANGLPITAIMAFDSADAATYDEAGLWSDIVLHEMLHGVGFGTVWNYLGLLDVNISDGYLDVRFNGENASEAFAEEFPELDDGLGPIVETDGGWGTAFGHWDETAFDNELMTGYLDLEENYVSEMTVASLEDLGYETVYGDDLVIA